MELTSWIVHPSWEGPRPIPDSFRGVEERDLSAWFLQLPDAEQDKLLKSEWDDVCDWAAQRAPDVVIVSGFPDGFEAWLAETGFVPAFFGMRIFEWAYRGTPEQIRDVMKALHTVPSIDIRVESDGHPVVHVLDQSWDFVVLYSTGEPLHRSPNPPSASR